MGQRLTQNNVANAQGNAAPAAQGTPAAAPAAAEAGANPAQGADGQTAEQMFNTPAAEPGAESSGEPAGFKLGNKTFKDQAEAEKYLADLEKSKIEKEAYRKGAEDAAAKLQEQFAKQTAATVKPEPESEGLIIEGQRIDELLFDEPAKALKLLQDDAIKKAEANFDIKYQEDKKTDRLWTDFYNANQDLAGQRDIVELVLQQNWDNLSKLPSIEAMKVLGEKTWEKIRQLRAMTGETETLSDTIGQTAGASSGGPIIANAQIVPKPLDFISQLAKLNKRSI